MPTKRTKISMPIQELKSEYDNQPQKISQDVGGLNSVSIRVKKLKKYQYIIKSLRKVKRIRYSTKVSKELTEEKTIMTLIKNTEHIKQMWNRNYTKI